MNFESTVQGMSNNVKKVYFRLETCTPPTGADQALLIVTVFHDREIFYDSIYRWYHISLKVQTAGEKTKQIESKVRYFLPI